LAFECGDTVTETRADASRSREAMFMNETPAPNATGLLRPLAQRSAIDPFIVMDVMGEANARESSGHDIIHMELASPRRLRQGSRANGRGKRLRMNGSAIPRRSACRA
jgi:hypothetical protein